MATLVKPQKERTKKTKPLQRVCNDEEQEEDCDELSTSSALAHAAEQRQTENVAMLEECPSALVNSNTEQSKSHEHCTPSDAKADISSENESTPTAPPAPCECNAPVLTVSKLVQYPDIQEMKQSNAILEEQKAEIFHRQQRQHHSSSFAIAHSQLKPLTTEELKQYYDCADLELVKQFELEFLMNTLLESSETDPLYAALLEYYNLQTKLTSNMHDVQKYRKECLDTQQVMWTREPVTRTFSATCGDGNVVRESITYDRIKVDNIKLEEATAALTKLYDLVCHTYTTNLISAKITKVKIDQLINDILAFPHVDAHADITLHAQLDDETLKCVSQLRRAISIVFGFTRKPSPNSQFDADIKLWLRKLVSLQLLLATKEDHWFLLFNILRCPSGVGAWSSEFLQLPGMGAASSTATQSNELPLAPTAPELSHCIAVLQILLLPIKKRNEFLKSCSQVHQERTGAEERWILVDSDGEDTHTPTGECVGLKESDLIALLNQIPFEKIFTSAMGIEKFLDDFIIEPDKITGQRLLTVVAFFAQINQILGDGLLTYNNERYKQLAKRLGRLVRHTLQYVFDYHELFMHNSVGKSPDLCERIDVELNALLIRACSYIYRTRNLATWQYFSTLPYSVLDTEAIWHLFYYLNVGFPNDLTTELVVDPAEAFHADEFWTKFNVANADVAPEDMYYLLQAFFEMANKRDISKDWELIKCICLHIFNIGFINTSTRDVCYKTARDMLVNITLAYEDLMACLLLQLKIRFMDIEKAPYLFRSLPLENWKPGMEDFEVLSNWLLHFSYTSPENMLARLVISHLNWGFDDDGRLFLPHNIHVRMACLISEAQMKHAPEVLGQSGISESVRQVSSLLDFTQSTREQFTDWCWSMISILRLHLTDQSVESVKRTLQNPTEPLLYVPELDRIDWIFQAVNEKRPLALFVAVLVSLHGHSIPLICQKGFDLLQQLLTDHRHAAVIRCIELIVPLFLETPETLANCEGFQKLLQTLLNADKTYLKVAKDMVYVNSVGPVLELFDNMLHHQITSYTSYGLYSPLNIINVWLNCFTALPGWSVNTYLLYLLDKMLRIAYQFTYCRVQAVEFFYNHFKDCEDWKVVPKPSALKAFFGTQSAARIPTLSPQHCWLNLVLLEIEFRLHDMRYWPELLRQLATSEPSSSQMDVALRKTLALTKTASFPPHMLVLYKYANLIAGMDVTHALFPIINQKFFELFLWRVPIDSEAHSFIHNFGVSDKFYDHNISLMKRIKTQLKAAENHYTSEAAKRAQDDAAGYFYRSCAKLMRNFTLWLEDTNINKYSRDTEQLPTQFNSEKLRELLNGNASHWTEFLNPSTIRKEQCQQADNWTRKCFRMHAQKQLRSPLQPKARGTTIERIKSHLSSYDKRQPPPAYFRPDLFKQRPINKKTLKELQRRIQTLNSTANKFHYNSSELDCLNRNYLDRVPALYQMVPYNETRNKECDSLLFNRKCTRPAQITLVPEHIRRNDQISRNMDVNRERHDKIIEEMLQLNVDGFAQAIEELGGCISLLLQAEQNKLVTEIGTDFFYHVVDNMTDITMKFQPTNDLYCRVLEELGVFIQSNQETQGLNILQLALRRGDLIKVFSGVFVPCQTSPKYFLQMYQFLIDSHLKRSDPKILFVLLSKFDLLTWLETFQPKLTEINQLLLLVLQGLESWSQPDSSLLQDQFRRQLVHIFGYDFPQHYGEVMQLVLDRISDQKLMSVVLLDLLNALLDRGNCGSSLTLDSNELQLNNTAMDFSRRQKLFNLKAGTDTCSLLARHFQKERLHHGLHGLYPKHKDYCPALAMWFTCFCHVVLTASICVYQELLADQISDIVFGAIIEMFAPWLIIYTDQTTQQVSAANWIRQLSAQGKMLLPWSEAHVTTCKIIIRSFISIVQYVLEYLPSSPKILEHVFAWYVHHFALPNVAGYVLAPIHDGLSQLPWERFTPKVMHIDQLYDSVQKYVPESHAMLGHIFIRIDWNGWFSEMPITTPTATVSRLFVIFVKLAFEPNIHIHPNTSKILEDAINYPWNLVEFNELEQLMKWFVATVEPAIVLKLPSESNYADRAVLDLLRLGCAMMPERGAPKSISQATTKRMLYTRSYICMQRACGAKHKKLLATKEGERAFNAAFVELLNSIDHAISATNEQHTQEEQRREALNLMLEIVAPTQTQSEEISNMHIDALVHWQLQCPPANPVMCAALSAIGHLNTYIACIYSLLETSIECYFRTSSDLSPWHAPTWRDLFQALHMSLPKLDLMPVMRGGYFFSLHVFVLYKMEEMENVGEKITFLQDLTQLLENLKTTPQTEPRLSLVWGLIISRGCQLLSLSEHAKKPLCMLARHLQVASTKSEGWSDGLLGAIGLKTEVITNRRKVLTRCLACIIYSLFPASINARLPCEEYESGMRELTMLLANKKFTDVKQLIVKAVSILKEQPVPEMRAVPHMVCRLIDVFYEQSFLATIPEVWDFDFKLRAS
ncbi:ectopic P granules protein 5 homolog [Scaptodrosophila lebanonensis]|uniref:Ectopic P granules protein 5 homolog n=1 Tax=Drosophila lebanonensis TaxID=7225 RepID=A0A6J2T5K8_DROLE|nr:ectopic P granules protein 5 homolog [Scaptodrosophila lebanonensis]